MQLIRLGDLEVKGVFSYDGKIYMKAIIPHVLSGLVPAVRIAAGRVVFLDKDTPVHIDPNLTVGVNIPIGFLEQRSLPQVPLSTIASNLYERFVYCEQEYEVRAQNSSRPGFVAVVRRMDDAFVYLDELSMIARHHHTPGASK